MRTQVGIVGAGPAGLMLSHLLHRSGIESIVLENRSRQYVQERVRAGVLEQGTVDLMKETGLGDRLTKLGMVHNGIYLRFERHSHHIDFRELTGKAITVYGQNNVAQDLFDARLAEGGKIFFEVSEVRLGGLDSSTPKINFVHRGAPQEIDCDFIAGCDGFHGISRPSIPENCIRTYEHVYPFGWLGILAEAPPSCDELIYNNHERGFALLSMRSPKLVRYYVQCAPDENIRNWPDDRIWLELRLRTETDEPWNLIEGPIVQKGITTMRSFVAEPMQYGRLFLAGDAAHIVPQTGAKGLNLAIADVRILARAFAEFYAHNSHDLLDRYSATCLPRVWQAERFSRWMTSLLHRNEGDSGFERKLQLAELNFVANSKAASKALAELYVGLPFDWPVQS